MCEECEERYIKMYVRALRVCCRVDFDSRPETRFFRTSCGNRVKQIYKECYKNLNLQFPGQFKHLVYQFAIEKSAFIEVFNSVSKKICMKKPAVF